MREDERGMGEEVWIRERKKRQTRVGRKEDGERRNNNGGLRKGCVWVFMWLIWGDIPVSHSWAKMSTGYMRISLSSSLGDIHTHTQTHTRKHTPPANTYMIPPPCERQHICHTCEHRCSIVFAHWFMTFCFVAGAFAAAQLHRNDGHENNNNNKKPRYSLNVHKSSQTAVYSPKKKKQHLGCVCE